MWGKKITMFTIWSGFSNRVKGLYIYIYTYSCSIYAYMYVYTFIYNNIYIYHIIYVCVRAYAKLLKLGTVHLL